MGWLKLKSEVWVATLSRAFLNNHLRQAVVARDRVTSNLYERETTHATQEMNALGMV